MHSLHILWSHMVEKGNKGTAFQHTPQFGVKDEEGASDDFGTAAAGGIDWTTCTPSSSPESESESELPVKSISSSVSAVKSMSAPDIGVVGRVWRVLDGEMWGIVKLFQDLLPSKTQTPSWVWWSSDDPHYFLFCTFQSKLGTAHARFVWCHAVFGA